MVDGLETASIMWPRALTGDGYQPRKHRALLRYNFLVDPHREGYRGSLSLKEGLLCT